MGATRVFIGVRRHGVLTCFDTWTRDYVCEDDPYLLLGRVLPPLARLGLDKVAYALESMKVDGDGADSDGNFYSAIEYWLADLEQRGDIDAVIADNRAAVVVPRLGGWACGVVVDVDARVVDWLRPPPGPLREAVEDRGVDVGGFVAALRMDEAKLEPIGTVFHMMMEGRFGGLLEEPLGDDWEIRLIHRGEQSVLRPVSQESLAARAAAAENEELPPGFVRHNVYTMEMFIPTEQDTLVVTGKRVDGVFQPVWADVARVGSVCAVLVEAGPYEIWQQRPAPFVDPVMAALGGGLGGADFHELLRAFDESRAVCTSKGELTLDDADDDGPDLSFITGSFTFDAGSDASGEGSASTT